MPKEAVRAAYDPIYSYYRVHRPAADWDRQVRQLYEARYTGAAPRPARTLAEQQKTVAAVQNNTILQQTGVALVPARQAEEAAGVKVEQVAREQRERFQAAAKQRSEAAHHYQETQLRKLVESRQGAAVNDRE